PMAQVHQGLMPTAPPEDPAVDLLKNYMQLGKQQREKQRESREKPYKEVTEDLLHLNSLFGGDQ
nr:Chain A, Gag polyprotein [Simian immunodeficiency virus]